MPISLLGLKLDISLPVSSSSFIAFLGLQFLLHIGLAFLFFGRVSFLILFVICFDFGTGFDGGGCLDLGFLCRRFVGLRSGWLFGEEGPGVSL